MFSRTRFSGGCTFVTPVIVKMNSGMGDDYLAQILPPLHPGSGAGTLSARARMYHIHVTLTIQAEPEKVFAFVSDHERFLRGPGVRCRLVTPGRENRNGVGAVREVTATGSVF